MKMDNIRLTDVSTAVRYLRLCLGSRWSPAALAEACALSASADFDWEALRQCAWDEGVALLWYSRVRGRDLAPRALKTDLQAAYRENALHNTALFCERDRVLRELRGDGIDVILLKGAALAETVYGDIALRPMSDVDLLAQPGDVSAIMQRLARAGYVTPVDLASRASLPVEYENEIAVSKPGDGPYRFDVHWGLLASPYYQHKISPAWFWETALPLDAAGTPARMLGPEAQVLHLAAHLILQHHGRGLKWWCDIAQVIWAFRQRLDWPLLFERAQTYDLVLPLQRVLPDLAEQWRLPIPASALEQLRALPPSPREQQVHAWLTDEHLPALRRFWGDLSGVPDWRGRLRYAGRKLFPSAAYMRWRYMLRRAWLLPFAYPYRWFLPVWRGRQHD